MSSIRDLHGFCRREVTKYIHRHDPRFDDYVQEAMLVLHPMKDENHTYTYFAQKLRWRMLDLLSGKCLPTGAMHRKGKDVEHKWYDFTNEMDMHTPTGDSMASLDIGIEDPTKEYVDTVSLFQTLKRYLDSQELEALALTALKGYTLEQALQVAYPELKRANSTKFRRRVQKKLDSVL
jgi:hypothetical protein